MNKKESGAAPSYRRTLVNERRQWSFGRFLYLQFIAFCVGKRLTLNGVHVNGQAARPLDGLLLVMEQLKSR
jgi:hypothetical protein